MILLKLSATQQLLLTFSNNDVAALILNVPHRSWCAEITGEMWTCLRLSTSWPFWWTKRRRGRSLQSWPMGESVSCGLNTITSTVSLIFSVLYLCTWYYIYFLCFLDLSLMYLNSLTHITPVVATSKKNASVSLVFSFLYKIVQVGLNALPGLS